MARRTVRIAWVAIGICLVISAGAGVFALLGPPNQPWHRALQELSTLVDIAALLFWIAIFAVYWSRKQKRGGG